MSKLRIVFMGTPDFAVACLDMLVAEKYDVVAVVTQPDRPKGRGQKLGQSPVKEAALAYGLPVLQPNKVREAEFQAQMSLLKPDLIVVVAFGQLLPKVMLDLPPLGCINVHASLLPYYRGAAPIHWALINGEEVTGVTTMYMDVGMDTGDMILKAEVPIAENATTGMIHDELKESGAQLLGETIQLIATQQAPRTVQPHAQATHASMLTREMEAIDWKKPASAIHNLVRGFNPWPGSYCSYQEKTLKTWQTRVHSRESLGNVPGEIIEITMDGFLVQTGEGTLEILEVQPASKRRMSAKDFVCGYGIVLGDILG
jgi:methionyl-tRNA formyltransferase